MPHLATSLPVRIDVKTTSSSGRVVDIPHARVWWRAALSHRKHCVRFMEPHDAALAASVRGAEGDWFTRHAPQINHSCGAQSERAHDRYPTTAQRAAVGASATSSQYAPRARQRRPAQVVV
eukprot:6383937-Prymnesium_polylepis.1